MIRLIQRRLIIPRGDTGTFTIPSIGANKTGSIAVFTIFDPQTRTYAFRKEINVDGDVLTISFSHNETVNLEPGRYLWDIKFYVNPVYNEDEELIDGTEVDSYYAGYSLPVCEIRETGDNYITANSNSEYLTPEQINIVTSTMERAELLEHTLENQIFHAPIIRDSNWYLWNADDEEYQDSGVRAQGIDGETLLTSNLTIGPAKTIKITDPDILTINSLKLIVNLLTDSTPSIEEPLSYNNGHSEVEINISGGENYQIDSLSWSPFSSGTQIYTGEYDVVKKQIFRDGTMLTYQTIKNIQSTASNIYLIKDDTTSLELKENTVHLTIQGAGENLEEYIEDSIDFPVHYCSHIIHAVNDDDTPHWYISNYNLHLYLPISSGTTIQEIVEWFVNENANGHPFQLYLLYKTPKVNGNSISLPKYKNMTITTNDNSFKWYMNYNYNLAQIINSFYNITITQ